MRKLVLLQTRLIRVTPGWNLIQADPAASFDLSVTDLFGGGAALAYLLISSLSELVII
jgi:hypothetical protein